MTGVAGAGAAGVPAGRMLARAAAARVLWAMAAILMIAGAFARTMTAKTYIRDENMYVTAGVMAGHEPLYSGFAYLQMPYTPLAYRVLFELTGTTHYLLTARLFSLGLMVVSALTVYRIARRMTVATDLALRLTLLFALNAHIMETTSYAWSAALGIPLSLLSIDAFLGAGATRAGLLRLVLSEVLLGLAAGTKAYYLAALPPFMVAAVSHAGRSRWMGRVATSAGSFLGGVVLGLSPALYSWWRHGDVFVFDNFVFHGLNTVWRIDTGYTRTMGPFSKLHYLREQWADPSNVALLVALLFLLAGGRAPGTSGKSGLKSLLQPDVVLCASLAAVTTAAAMLPTPLWPHYFAMPVPFVVILVAALCRRARDAGAGEASRTVLGVAVILCIVFSGTRVLRSLAALRHRDRWVPMTVHDTALEIRARLMKNAISGKVATLSPIYAIEAGLPIYKELASGVFMYRIGDYLSPDQRRRYVTTSPRTIGSLFATDAPRAVVTGAETFEGDLEQPLVTWAEQGGYEKLDVGGLKVYVRGGDPR